MNEASKILESEEGDWEDVDDGKLILAEGGHKDGEWQAVRIWGFKEMEGERRYVQAVHVWNGKGEGVKGDMVYEFIGS